MKMKTVMLASSVAMPRRRRVPEARMRSAVAVASPVTMILLGTYRSEKAPGMLLSR